MLAYDYPLLGIFWSLVMLFMFIAVAYIVVYTLIDNFRRPDHSGLAKAGWLLLIIVLPLLGAQAGHRASRAPRKPGTAEAAEGSGQGGCPGTVR